MRSRGNQKNDFKSTTLRGKDVSICKSHSLYIIIQLTLCCKGEGSLLHRQKGCKNKESTNDYTAYYQ